MAKAQKEQKLKGVTPEGVFKFPNVVEPDYGTDEYPTPEGEYNVRLVLDQGPANKLLETVQPELDRAIEEAEEKFKKLPVATRKKLKAVTVNDLLTEVFDPDTEEPTGQYEVKLKTKASGVSQKTGKPWTRKLPLFDAKRNPLTGDDLQVWGGTIGKLAYTANPYFIPATGVAGVSLYLDAVQIKELSNGTEKSASGFGFDEEEGFSADDGEEESDPFGEEEEEEQDGDF